MSKKLFANSSGEATGREPIGGLMGSIGVGKTSRIGEAFPHYGYVLTSTSGLDGTYAYRVWRGKTPYSPKAKAFVTQSSMSGDLWRMFRKLPQTIRMQGKQALEAKGVPLLGKRVFADLGIEFPHPVAGLVLSDYTTLLNNLQQSLRRVNPKIGYDLGPTVMALMNEISQACQEVGLGYILDGHQAPPKYAKGDTARISPEYLGGFETPWGAQRAGTLKDFSFVWQIVDPDTESGERLCITKQDRLTLRKTRAPINIPPRVVVMDKTTSLRELLVYCGMLTLADISLKYPMIAKNYPEVEPIDPKEVEVSIADLPEEMRALLQIPDTLEIARRLAEGHPEAEPAPTSNPASSGDAAASDDFDSDDDESISDMVSIPDGDGQES